MSHRGRIAGGLASLALGVALSLTSALSLAGPRETHIPTFEAPATSQGDYRIGALDKLNITVFQNKDLTVEKMQVDAGGRILLPLVGGIAAAGKTTTELSDEIAARLAERYMQNPQVSVTVDEAVSQKVSVEGAVNEAGVFELKGRTSLLEAVARAKGANRYANLHHVTIIRNVEGAPHAATFDLAAIGLGKARNPEVVGNDIVVVEDFEGEDLLAWRRGGAPRTLRLQLPVKRVDQSDPNFMKTPFASSAEEPSAEADEVSPTAFSGGSLTAGIGREPLFAPTNPAATIDFAVYGRALLRRRWTVLATLIAALAIGVVVTLLTPPIYTAEATLQIDREPEKVVSRDEVTPADNLGEEFYQTQYGLLRSRALAERVAQSLGLLNDDAFIQAMKDENPAAAARTAARGHGRAAVVVGLLAATKASSPSGDRAWRRSRSAAPIRSFRRGSPTPSR